MVTVTTSTAPSIDLSVGNILRIKRVRCPLQSHNGTTKRFETRPTTAISTPRYHTVWKDRSEEFSFAAPRRKVQLDSLAIVTS